LIRNGFEEVRKDIYIRESMTLEAALKLFDISHGELRRVPGVYVRHDARRVIKNETIFTFSNRDSTHENYGLQLEDVEVLCEVMVHLNYEGE